MNKNRQQQQLESFLEISQRMTSTFDQGLLMQMIVDNAIRIMGLGSGAVYLRNDEQTIKLAATAPALPVDFPEEFRVSCIKDHPHIEKAFLTGHPVIMADTFSSTLTPAEEKIIRMRELRSNLYLPIMLREQTIGVLILSSVSELYNFVDEEIYLLQGFANQAAQIFENNHNYNALKKYAQDLELEVKERKRIEMDLIAAKNKAEESDRLKTAFLQNMSHEIRTPLNGIIGFSELINNPELDSNQRKHFTDIIIERGWQLSTIVENIITISSLETQQEELHTDIVDVNQLIGEQLSVFARQANHKGLRLISGDLLAEEEAMVYSDRIRLGQVINNLIHNALKFTEHGEIVLGCQNLNNQLRFYVRDTGIGIDKSKSDLIFKSFIQADDSIRQTYGGIGLGLPICKGYIELMGGKIGMDSEPGQGSTFWFTIPFNPVSDIKGDIIPESATVKEDKTLQVLVAEDEEFNFLYLEALLDVLAESLNLKVVHAVNGQQAVDICRDQPIDIVLMDIKMPIMDGYTATKQIREFKPWLPIIAQTAYALKSEIQLYGDVFDEYITKPFGMEKLRQVLRKFVNAGE